MTATNGWPGKPGVPRDPGLPGAHWLKGYTEDVWMYDGDGGWWGPGYSHKLDAETVAARYSYLGPCLTPDEAAALQARADQAALGHAREADRADRSEFLHKQEIDALQKRVAELEDFCEDYLVRFELFHITNTQDAPEDATGFLAEKARAILGAALTGGKDE